MVTKNTCSFFALLLILLSAACSDEPETVNHLEAAKVHLENSEHNAAIIELKNALQEDRASAEARWLLGKIYLSSHQMQAAEKELNRALDSGWPRDDVVPALVKSLLHQQKYTEVLEFKESGLDDAAAGSLFASQSQAELERGNYQQALTLADQAATRTPSAPAILLARARALAALGKEQDARQMLDQLLPLTPDNAAAWELSGDLLMGQGKLQAAARAYSKALDLTTTDASLRIKRAMASLHQHDFDTTQQDTAVLLRLVPQHPGVNYIQGVLHFRDEQYEKAESSLLLAEPAADQLSAIYFFLGASQLLQGKLEAANLSASHFHQTEPENIAGRRLLATIRLLQKQYQEVEDLLGPVIDQKPDDAESLNLLANALLRNHKLDEGIALLSRVAELQPDSPEAQVRLGVSLLLDGEDESAREHIGSALTLAPEYAQADILLVMSHARQRDFEAAIAAAEAFRRRNPGSLTPLNLLGQVYSMAKRPEEANAAWLRALQLDRSDPSANRSLARAAMAQENYGAARGHYEAILENHTEHLSSMIQLAALDMRKGDERLAVERLEAAISAHPNAAEPRIILSKLYLGNDQPEKVATVFTGFTAPGKDSEKVLLILAATQLSMNKLDDSLFTLEQLAKNANPTPQSHHLRATAAVIGQDHKKAEQEFEAALALDPTYLPSRIALTKLAHALGQFEKFQTQLKSLQAEAPHNPDVMILAAAAADMAGNTEAATEQLELVYARRPDTAVVLSLARHKVARQENAEATRILLEWLDKHPSDIKVRTALANLYLSNGDTRSAIKAFESVIEYEPGNMVALNNLAWLLRESAPSRALQLARKASELAPHSGEILDTLAVIEYSNENYHEASQNIARAQRLLPQNPSIKYHSAMIAAAAGDHLKAIATLEELARTNPDFPEALQAQALLQSLGN